MAKQTFENAMKRLEAIVQDLESGDLTLDEAMKKFQEGVKLSSLCSQRLDETEKRVSILLKDEDGKVRVEPFSPDNNPNDDTA
ncbi:MAG: exodeoxyribonuclease VII small subunit [Deltaproteobacteria bacterium]|nr:exodeoxyribonuclease VII small subunit [Deltaproteobacteria bacterium]MBW2170677.1 exodeoxyribonuclease VII small subunit [Deltaproteobacteria bacterium]MBW2259820.1 exodeoxyribonuclease VII small subunit [Deltaproteobacteria bacterium]